MKGRENGQLKRIRIVLSWPALDWRCSILTVAGKLWDKLDMSRGMENGNSAERGYDYIKVII